MLTLAALPAATGSEPPDSALLVLRGQAEVLAPLMRTQLARRFLAATVALPPAPGRTLYCHPVDGAFYSEAETRALPDSIRARLEPHALEGRYYYQTRYGSPLNYARAIELVALAGLESLAGKRVLDFGYGTRYSCGISINV